MKSINELDLKGKSVIVRVDFNVPMRDGSITDDSRIKAAIPTLKELAKNNCKVILLSHLGRPQKDTDSQGNIKKKTYSLRLVAERLNELLPYSVSFVDENTGEKVTEAASKLKEGEFLVLENTRFAEGEKNNSAALAADWRALGEIYVNHAFTVALAEQFNPDSKGAGLLMSKEVAEGYSVLENPTSPVVAVVGGSKVSDKIGLLENMIDLADEIIIGGGMAYTFIAAQGGLVGNSLLEEDYFQLARKIVKKAKDNNTGI